MDNQLKTFLYENKKDMKILFSNLGIALLILCILIEFFNRITNNFISIFSNYNDGHRLIYGTNKIAEKDNYRYESDTDFNNKKLQILKSIRRINVNNENTFKDLIDYKKKYNLDTDINSKIDNKILSSENDNYQYNNSPNIIEFLLDIFKPTKA
jgi:hypothetical protein